MICARTFNPQTSIISRSIVCISFVDQSDADADGASIVFILDLTSIFNGLNKSNCKTRREMLVVDSPFIRGLTLPWIYAHVREHMQARGETLK